MKVAVTRLKRRQEFLRVAGSRRKWVAPGLILQVRRHGPDDGFPGDKPPFRVGFTVSRKVGNAVERNRARRRLIEAVERVMPAHAKGGFDFVVIGRKRTLRRPFTALVTDLVSALRHLEAYHAPTGGTSSGTLS